MAHEHTTTATDGTAIAWSSRGEGDPVVLVHGITESATSLAPVADRLADSHRVVTLDLRGHGESGTANDYGLAAMVGDVAAVISAAGLVEPHLVGHSLGGAVVTAAGAAIPVRSVVDIDQSLQLAEFKALVVESEPMLRDAEQFPLAIGAMFGSMAGSMLSDDETARLDELRRADQDVVLGVWGMLLTEPADEIDRSIDEALAGYVTEPTPYLALFGIDPGDGYDSWLAERVPGAIVERWPDHGHYPHLVDPDRFVARLLDFWQ
jgi:pimeloyl-ACP methyl ester carboxylesterase